MLLLGEDIDRDGELGGGMEFRMLFGEAIDVNEGGISE